jgi:hypothetical protein
VSDSFKVSIGAVRPHLRERIRRLLQRGRERPCQPVRDEGAANEREAALEQLATSE